MKHHTFPEELPPNRQIALPESVPFSGHFDIVRSIFTYTTHHIGPIAGTVYVLHKVFMHSHLVIYKMNGEAILEIVSTLWISYLDIHETGVAGANFQGTLSGGGTAPRGE